MRFSDTLKAMRTLNINMIKKSVEDALGSYSQNYHISVMRCSFEHLRCDAYEVLVLLYFSNSDIPVLGIRYFNTDPEMLDIVPLVHCMAINRDVFNTKSFYDVLRTDIETFEDDTRGIINNIMCTNNINLS